MEIDTSTDEAFERECRLAGRYDLLQTDTENFSVPIDKQVGGNHYIKHTIQPWDIIDEYNLNFYEGTAIKYILRDKDNRVQDIEKAIHTLQKLLEDMKDGR